MEKQHKVMGFGHSDLYENQTPKQFWETVDKALEAEGISIEDVKQMQTQLNKESDFALTNELIKLTFSAYVRLRALGYNRYDLTA